MDDKEFQVALSALEDCRRFIAAGKVQRWDVLKWGVTVNTALAAAALTIGRAAVWFVLITMSVAVASGFLLWHYNNRVTGARDTATELVGRMKKSGVDFEVIVGTSVANYSQGPTCDEQELFVFGLILLVSALLPLLALVRAG